MSSTTHDDLVDPVAEETGGDQNTSHKRGLFSKRSSKKRAPKKSGVDLLEEARTHKPYFNRFVSDWQNILEENRLLRLTSLVSAGVTIICLGILLTQGDRTRTILVPMAPSASDIYITGNEPSDAYLEAVGRDVIGLIGTFTGSSAQSQFDRLLVHVHPSAYNTLRTEWAQLATDMRGYREVTFATYVRPEEAMNLRADVLVVPTQRVRFIGATRSTENGYSEIGYLIENGRFWVTSYNFIPKGAQRVSKASE